MTVIYLFLLLAATVCFLLAAVGVAARVNLVALGLFLWVLVAVVQVAHRLV